MKQKFNNINRINLRDKINLFFYNVYGPTIVFFIVIILEIVFFPISKSTIFYNLIHNKYILVVYFLWFIYTILHLSGGEVIKILFNPCSPVITLIVGWLLTLLVTTINSDSDINGVIKLLIINKNFILIILLFWIIMAIMYTGNEHKLEIKDNEIKRLKNIILEKENQLNQSSGIILNKYGEFSNFNKKIRFKEVLKSFVEKNDLVDSAQIYKYSKKYDPNGNLNIKLTYEEGYTYEGIEINNISQIYYTIERNYYEKIKRIVPIWKKYIINRKNIYTEEETLLLEFLSKEINNLLTDIKNDLEKITEDKIESIDFDKYRLGTLLIRMLSCNDKAIEIEQILQNESIENILHCKKRTELLGSILLEDTYIFKHDKEGSKKGRIYFTFYVQMYGENYIILFAIAPKDMNENEKWNDTFDNLKSDLIEKMQMTGCELNIKEI